MGLQSERASRETRAPAFTLVELVVSVAITAILFTGLTSIMVLATRALPDENRPTDQLAALSRVADQIVAELEYAQSITERSVRTLAFTVADRNGDGAQERIRYAWSGTPGDPLTREYNGAEAVSVVEHVNAFDLSYELRSASEAYTGLPIEGSVVPINWYTGAGNRKDYSVNSNNWIGQYFQPSGVPFPAGSAWWRLTRVAFLAKKDGNNEGQVKMQIRTPNADMTPSATILEEKILYESGLTDSLATQYFDVDAVTGMGPSDGLCFVLAWGSGGATISKVQFDDGAGAGRLVSSNAGASWSYNSGKALIYAAYGRVCTPGPLQYATRDYVTGVHLTLQGDSDTATHTSTAARLLNAPEVLSGVWEADFSVDPTTVDWNGDGLPDWAMQGGGPLGAATLVGGVWVLTTTLNTNPGNDFVGLTAVEAVFRDVTSVGDGAVIRIPVDRSGSTYGAIIARLSLQTGGTQTLTVHTKPDAATERRLVLAPGLPDAYIQLRLLIDPALNTVNVRINGQDYGTHPYLRFAGDTGRTVQLYAEGGDTGARFDYVRVRVGGS